MQTLIFTDNPVTAALPYQWAGLPLFSYIDLSRTLQILLPIPSEWAAFQALEYLNLQSTGLVGTLPAFIANFGQVILYGFRISVAIAGCSLSRNRYDNPGLQNCTPPGEQFCGSGACNCK
jgi:hypothetical protein